MAEGESPAKTFSAAEYALQQSAPQRNTRCSSGLLEIVRSLCGRVRSQQSMRCSSGLLEIVRSLCSRVRSAPAGCWRLHRISLLERYFRGSTGGPATGAYHTLLITAYPIWGSFHFQLHKEGPGNISRCS